MTLNTPSKRTADSTINPTVSRRKFVAIGAAVGGCLAAPAIHAANKSGKEIVLGEGEHQFRVHHHWAQLPSQYSWQTTHNVAVDAAGNLYVIHEGLQVQADHPSIFVFDSQGKFMQAFGQQFQGGGHGLEVQRRQRRVLVRVGLSAS
ncbi:MAG: hypothetical protein R3C53_14725 [Pirellulaceae bacterium]